MVPTKNVSKKMADLTFDLLEKCQQKQEMIAESLKLTVSEFKALRYFKKDKMLSVGNLAKRMRLSNSRLTRIVDGLVKKQLITRDLSPKDRRVMEICMTEEGIRIANNLNKCFYKSQEEIIKYLKKGSEQSVLNSLENLNNALKIWVSPK